MTQTKSNERKVCFIGDGINDTIALKQADASVSLAAAAVTLPAAAMVAILFAQGSLPLAVICNIVGCSAGFAVALRPIRERRGMNKLA